MKSLTIWLLVLVCGSCLLRADANAVEVDSFSYEEIQAFDDGFLKTMEKIFKKCLTTVRGVNCSMKTVLEVLIATTNYVDAIDACGGEVPKDVAKIVKSCHGIISICEDILHMKSTICAHDEDAKMTSFVCFLNLLESMMKLTRRINVTIKLMLNMGVQTEACFSNATDELLFSYNNFMPHMNKCIDEM